MKYHPPYTTAELVVWWRAYRDDTAGHRPTVYGYRVWRKRCCPTAPDDSTFRKHFGTWAAFTNHPGYG